MSNDKTTLTESTLQNSAWALSLSLLGKVGGFFFTIILARLLMPEGFGTYSLILAMATIFMVFGDLGINKVLLVLLSKNFEKKEQAQSYFKFLYRIKLVLLTSISSLFILIAYFISANYLTKSDPFLLLIFCAFYIFFLSLSRFFSSFFYIYKKVKLDFYKELIFQITRLVLIVLVFLFLDKSDRILGIFLVLALSSMVLCFFSYIFSKKISNFSHSQDSVKKIDKKRILKLLFYFMLGSISLIIFSEIDVLMIGFLVNNLTYLGYYRAYFAVVMGISGLMGFGAVLLPIFSSFNDFRIKDVFNKVSKYVLLFSIPACFGFLVLGSYFIKFFYGDNYLPGILIMYFLVFLIFSESLTYLFDTVISSQERPKFIAASLFITILLNIILNYLLITTLIQKSPLLAVSGAAIATLISRYFFMFCLGAYSFKHFKIVVPRSNILKPLAASIIMALQLFVLSKIFHMNLFFGIILIILGAIFYFSLMIIFGGIVKQDKIILEILSHKIKSILRIKKKINP